MPSRLRKAGVPSLSSRGHGPVIKSTRRRPYSVAQAERPSADGDPGAVMLGKAIGDNHKGNNRSRPNLKQSYFSGRVGNAATPTSLRRGEASHSDVQLNASSHRKPSTKSDLQRPAASVNHSDRKRRSNHQMQPPPARRQRRGDQPNSGQNEAPLHTTIHLPTTKDYPGAPKMLDSEPKNFVTNNLARVVSTKQECASISLGRFRCTVFCDVPGHEPFEAIGEDTNKVNQIKPKYAYLHLLGLLHAKGILKKIYASEPDLESNNLEADADAKVDVYNYAAQFDSVPIYSSRAVLRPLRARGNKAVEVTVEFPQQELKAVARALTAQVAEVAASTRFKSEAEKYHAMHGDETMIVKDSTVLNANNAKSFFEYYKCVFPKDIVDIKTEPISRSGQFSSQLLLNRQPLSDPVLMFGKKKAEDVAHLVAALAVKKRQPELYPRFQHALRAGNGQILKPIPPLDMVVDEAVGFIMRDTLSATRKAGLSDIHEEISSEETVEDRRRLRSRGVLDGRMAVQRNEYLESHQRALETDPTLASMRSKRVELPLNHFRSQVIDLVERSTYSIVVGATGSGKTTQVPQILLERAISGNSGSACNIICTQPRRIAAISVARRVAEERNEPLQNTVGYQVRFDTKLPRPGGSIAYCTTGILLQQLQHSPDEIFDSTSHIIIDEVHERDILVDFLLVILKKRVQERERLGRPSPRVVLMSATMDVNLFAKYLGHAAPDGTLVECPHVSVPGRTFPVRETYLDDILQILRKSYPNQMESLKRADPSTKEFLAYEEDFARSSPARRTGITSESTDDGGAAIEWKREGSLDASGDITIMNERENAAVPTGLVSITVEHVAKTTEDGAILVFLPGLEEMVKVENELRQQSKLGIDFNNSQRFKLYMLHSSIPAHQNDVFNPVASGCRKIILATNIAETSITIPDVQYVIDTGKHREKQYDQVRRITRLQCTWISKSNAKQRAGRAGRVQNGNYSALYSKSRHESFRTTGLPEILRSDLQEICLNVKAQGFSTPIRSFLSAAIEPPSAAGVDASVVALQNLEALTDEEQLTPLGRLLAQLPVHPALGKMIILGVIFRCLDPILILGAASNERPLFVTPMGARAEVDAVRRSFAQDTSSDHLALINAFRKMRNQRSGSSFASQHSFARNNFLHMGAFKTIEQTTEQIEEILVKARLIPPVPLRERKYGELGGPSLNVNSQRSSLVKALTLAGLHPNLAVATSGRTFRSAGERNAMIHPASVNVPPKQRGYDERPSSRRELLTFSTMAKSADGGSMFLRDTSRTSPLMSALFGGRLRSKSASILEMDDWLPFRVKTRDLRALKTVVEFRKALDRLLTSAFQDLSKRGSGEKGYLADQDAIAQFAEGVVEVLAAEQTGD
ncbi:MAG: hypothetical protein M1833_003970 [Piccolia ochrophora]|nr:MAG: hypothetical protein M1833_003970 [Piccolia ochrophora]